MVKTETKPVTRTVVRTETATGIVLRDKATGQLMPGTAGISPGRPSRQQERIYLDVMQAECTPAIWADITRVAIKDALDGDRFAQRFLASYIIGPPVKRVIAKLGGTLPIEAKDIDQQFVQFLAILNTIVVETSTLEDTSGIIDGELLE